MEFAIGGLRDCDGLACKVVLGFVGHGARRLADGRVGSVQVGTTPMPIYQFLRQATKAEVSESSADSTLQA